MVYVRFNPDREHGEICQFEEWDNGIVPCGAKAVGYRGARLATRQCLCAEHFEYARLLDGVHEVEVKQKQGRKK